MGLRILVLNAGSSSLKWSLVEHPTNAVRGSGNVKLESDKPPALRELLGDVGPFDAIAHRVVHGGPEFVRTVKVDARVRERIEALREIDPLHAPRALRLLDAAEAAFPGVDNYACFDTAFHATLPPAATTYAIPLDWSERWQLWRFGFHGLSVAWSLRRAPEVAGRPLSKLVVCHLGSGCSVTAASDGKSRDTTMGFTPLEGLAMATRSGSVDPGLLIHLVRERGMPIDELSNALEHESGLRGLTGGSGDFREVLAAADGGDARAKLAYEVFVHGVRRGIGQVLASLDGLDALVFTGGIGEHSARLRADVVSHFGWLGLAVDDARNPAAKPDADLSASGSGPRVLVIEAREDLTMVSEVAKLLGASSP